MNTVQYRSVTSKDDKEKMFMSDGDFASDFKVKETRGNRSNLSEKSKTKSFEKYTEKQKKKNLSEIENSRNKSLGKQ